MISSGAAKGMVEMDGSLRRLIAEDIIDPLAGLEKALDKDGFRKWMKEEGWTCRTRMSSGAYSR